MVKIAYWRAKFDLRQKTHFTRDVKTKANFKRACEK